MKYILLLSLFVMTLFPAKKDPVKIVFFGDSITQIGVQKDGYVTMVQDYIDKNHPGEYTTIGAGIGGNKVYDLYFRLDEILKLQADVVVIYVGINDVWHKSAFGTGTDPDKFVGFYQKIISELKSHGAQVILATPTVIGEKNDFSNREDGDLNHYANLIRELAKKNELRLVDLREAFVNYLKENNPENLSKGILTNDTVHLTKKGNELVAEEMIKILF